MKLLTFSKGVNASVLLIILVSLRKSFITLIHEVMLIQSQNIEDKKACIFFKFQFFFSHPTQLLRKFIENRKKTNLKNEIISVPLRPSAQSYRPASNQKKNLLLKGFSSITWVNHLNLEYWIIEYIEC